MLRQARESQDRTGKGKTGQDRSVTTTTTRKQPQNNLVLTLSLLEMIITFKAFISLFTFFKLCLNLFAFVINCLTLFNLRSYAQILCLFHISKISPL